MRISACFFKAAITPALVLSSAFMFANGAGMADAQSTRKFSFPDTKDGWHVLSVDTHIHTVFSDGLVWPSIRVDEAVREGLDAIAITDHIETQAHYDDIPNPDRNRSYELAVQRAKELHSPLVVIKGVEIARPNGTHFNALFIRDANPLRHREYNAVFKKRGTGRPPYDEKDVPFPDAFSAVKEAKTKQGAFIIYNHPFSARTQDAQQKMLQQKLMDGVEVVNAFYYDENAFQYALDNNLAVIGASDLHVPASELGSNYSEPGHDDLWGKDGQRPATLVLAKDRTEASIKEAFEAHRTVALYRDTLIGREPEVRPIVEAALSLHAKGAGAARMQEYVFRNTSSSPFYLQKLDGPPIVGDAIVSVFTVPAHGELTARILGAAPKSLSFEVLNALTAPGHSLHVTLPIEAK